MECTFYMFSSFLCSFIVASTTGTTTNAVFPNGTVSYAPLPTSSEEDAFVSVRGTASSGSLSGLYTLTGAMVDAVRSGTLPYDDVIIPLVRSYYQPPAEQAIGAEAATPGSSTSTLTSFISWAAGVVVLSVLGLVAALCLPVCGLALCCCRRKGRCGGNLKWSKPKGNAYDTKTINCKKKQTACCIVLLVFVGIFLSLIMVGMVVSFSFNQEIHNGFQKALPTILATVDTTEEFARSAVNAASFLAVEQLNFTLGVVVEEASSLTNDLIEPIMELFEPRFDSFVDRVTNVSSGLNTALDDITDVLNQFIGGGNGGTELERALEAFTQALANLRSHCVSINFGACVDNVDEVSMAQFTGTSFIADVSIEVDSFRALLPSDMNATLRLVNDTLNDLPNILNDVIKNALRDAPSLLLSPVSEGLNSAENTVTELFRSSSSPIGQLRDPGVQQSINSAINARYVFALLGLAAVTLVVVLVVAGLACGLGGYRASRLPPKRTTLSNVGAVVLLVSAGFIFFATCAMLITASFTFSLGSVMRKFCLAVEDPEYEAAGRILDSAEIWGNPPLGSVISAAINTQISVNNTPFLHPFSQLDINATELFKNCKNNVPLYMAINGDNLLLNPVGLSQPVSFGQLRRNPQMLIDIVNLSNVTELVNLALATVMPLELFDLFIASVPNPASLNLTPFFTTARATISGINSALPAARTTLNIINFAITVFQFFGGDASGVALLINDLSNAINALQTAVQAFLPELDTLEQTVLAVQASVAMFLDSLRSDVLFLVDEINASIMQSNSSIVAAVNSTLENNLLPLLEQFVAYAIGTLKEDALRCGPLSNAYINTVDVVCRQITSSMNGFWFAIGWCALFFIPLVASVIALSKHFRRHSASLVAPSVQIVQYTMETYNNPNVSGGDPPAYTSEVVMPVNTWMKEPASQPW